MDFIPQAYGGETTNKNLTLSNTTSATFIQKLFPSSRKVGTGYALNGAGSITFYTTPANKIFILTSANVTTSVSSDFGSGTSYILITEGTQTFNICYCHHTQILGRTIQYSSNSDFNPSALLVFSAGTIFNIVSGSLGVGASIQGFEIDKYEWDNYIYKTN